MQKLEYYLFKLALVLSRILPFSVIYALSDLLYLVLYYVVGYRKRVVFNNLQNAFPEKTHKEIKQIAKDFYKNLSDIFLETLKFYTISKEELVRRVKVLNPEIVHKYYDAGINIITASGHLGNWEIGTQIAPIVLKHLPVVLYKPLKNKYIDQEIKRLRSRFGTKMISIQYTKLAFEKNTRFCIVMLSDQNPSNPKKSIWIDFLNQKTPVLHGLELYSKLYKLPIIYFEIQKVRRGYYEIFFEELITDPTKEPKGAISYKFMKRVEKSIKEKPASWLWSHKRWKHKFNNDYFYYKPENDN